MSYTYLDYPSLIKNICRNGYTNEQPIKKSNDEFAQEVMKGKWGKGADRRERLTAAGYDYSVVQDIVNQKVKKNDLKSVDKIAEELIRGKWGNGAERVKRLTDAI